MSSSFMSITSPLPGGSKRPHVRENDGGWGIKAAKPTKPPLVTNLAPMAVLDPVIAHRLTALRSEEGIRVRASPSEVLGLPRPSRASRGRENRGSCLEMP